MNQRVCSTCGSSLSENSKFCGKCGTPIKSTEAYPSNKCKNCGFMNPSGSRFCQNCGEALSVMNTENTGNTAVSGSQFLPPQKTPQNLPIPSAGQTSYINQPSPFTMPISRPEVKDAVYEDFIKPANVPLVTSKDKQQIISITIALALASGFKFMLLFDAFPPLETWLLLMVLMGSFNLIHIMFMRSGFRSSGFAIDFKTTRFDILATTVLSTFFVSYLGIKRFENKELSSLKEPRVILVLNFDQKKFKDPNISSKEYFYKIVHPKVKRNFLLLSLALGFIMNYLAAFFVPSISVSFRLLSNFIALYILTEIFPGIGRDKLLIKSIPGWQGLIFFIGGFLLLVFTMGVDVRNSLDLIF